MAAPRILLLFSLLLAVLQGWGQRLSSPHSPLEEVVTEGNLSLSEGWAVLGDQAALRPCRSPQALHCESSSHSATSGVQFCPRAERCHRQCHGDVCALGAQSHPSCPLVVTRGPGTVPSWATHAPVSPIGRGYNSKMEVVVGEADPRSYAIIYYQDSQGLSVKLYGRSSQLSDTIVDKFEQRARAMGLSEDVTHYFPTYGFCDSADDFHILDETEL